MNKIFLIDAIGPFFPKRYEEDLVNWSKVHFSQLESGKRLSASTRKYIERRFLEYVARAEALGYNSLSIDDLAHLVVLPWYNPDLRKLLDDYKLLYKRLFEIAEQKSMRVFVNTDYLFFNQDIDTYLQQTNTNPSDFFKQALEQVFHEFPKIDGIIMRLGETDGKDVHGTFLSRLTIKTPRQLNKLLGEVLPVFEAAHKRLIVRTWTVGAYKIGDLIWNKKTYDAVFSSIVSPALIISMKFGDTDFMRYLQLTPFLLSSQHNKIIELQTRREWEGMGLFPSFVGWEYASYLQRLKNNDSIVGIHVWCQTGGWAKQAWTNVTYLDNSSPWNELDTEVTISIARHGVSVEEAVAIFCKARGITNVERFVDLLRYAEIAILKGIYVPDLAQKTLYFRRTRIPPLLWLTWDRVLMSPIAMMTYRSILPAKNNVLYDADQALEGAIKMREIAKEIGLDAKYMHSLEFEIATLELFKQLKCYLLDGSSSNTFQDEIRSYQEKYPQHYSVPPLSHTVQVHKLPRWVLKLLVREKVAYRVFDVFLLQTSYLQSWLVRLALRLSKSRLATQAMGIDTLFK